MPTRTFLVASGVARIIQRELGSQWRVEGYLNGGDLRRTHVVIEGDQGHLFLEEMEDGRLNVEETTVPRRYADGLLEACLGRLDVERTVLNVSGKPALLDRISGGSKRIDVLTVYLEEGSTSFFPPPWVGREAKDGALDRRSLALTGLPDQAETMIANSGLEAVLDFLERAHTGSMAVTHVAPEPPTAAPRQSEEPLVNLTEVHVEGQAAEGVGAVTRLQKFRQNFTGVLQSAVQIPPERSEPAAPEEWAGERKRR